MEVQPDAIAGDFIMEQQQHPKFKRRHDDLFLEHTINLTEALCGFQFSLTHLDGRQLLIKSNPGELIKPGQSKPIKDEGMPQYERPFMKGCLYIHFNVEFPDTLSPEKCKALQKILPQKPNKTMSDNLVRCQETTLYDVNMEEEMRRKSKQQRRQDLEDYDDTPDVQCVQQ